ncbi:unnamed protein product [Vicia faba]|uniref:ESF1 RRM domain-containing protein n=1 Tax=Vicia faba TaxID=3906 RepID=A0AAV1B8N3_VICFA|nr:unnamed protein product [Vicia faba]
MKNKKNHGENKGKKKMMKNKGNSKPDKPSHNDDNTIDDPRFSSVHTDPSFPARLQSIKQRFQLILDSTACSLTRVLCLLLLLLIREGKPKDKANSQPHSLRHYYKIDEDDRKKVDEDSDDDEEEGLVKIPIPDGDIDEKDYEEEAPEIQEEIAEIEKETHRLAVVNMDWRYVKAVDLYVLFSSLAPPNGLIKIDNGDSDADNEKLRAYEKSRMRYYFALVECLFRTIWISNSHPKDVATETPANYENKDFYSRALQHSKVELTWDEDEPARANTLKRKFNDEQLAQLEMDELVASDVSESDDSEDNNETDGHADKKARKKSNVY